MLLYFKQKVLLLEGGWVGQRGELQTFRHGGNYFSAFSEHGIFHGISQTRNPNLLKIKHKNLLLIIEWE
ncbi:hypothetical protein Q7C_1586 [Methylophaga frappieri]|uniref:Uncharacterized protein n=1 Tax=Methylophaga frappieri (strain ATCC BAA-2434 / DSM 25690 / JAM7) TaxID=754477 RepID=I1YIJ2_METFJ|nr:hypothetical protein Q7C_1586 [Methylophaga frappieri]